MKFRYARHTNNIRRLTEFYTEIIGLKILGSFQNHSDYNGVFLGLPDQNWHIEFTESLEPANHHPDADDLLVFYFDNTNQISKIIDRALKADFSIIESKNPYWQTNGTELKDPDGFGIVLTLDKSKISN